jgi:nicotinate-nucleotide adenylyltransferase
MQRAMKHQSSPVRVGILGGTFDPPHHGHLLMAERARVQYDLHHVIFLPAGVPPHKRDEPITAREHRWAMTELACADHTGFFISRRELDREGPSYTIDTLRDFQERLGPETRLYFIMGQDSAEEVETWKQPQALREEVTLLVAPRPGKGESWQPEDLPEGMFPIDMPACDLSSTAIREAVAEGRPISHLVPAAVEAYIEKHNLYRTANT